MAVLLLLSCRVHDFSFGKTQPFGEIFWDKKPVARKSINGNHMQKCK